MTIYSYDSVTVLWKSEEGIGVSKADEKDRLEIFLDRNRGLNFIAMENNSIVGTILCGNDGRRGYLYHLFVLPEHRKKGIGKQLADICISNLMDQNITKCHIMFFNHNTTGKLFWEKIGFTLRDDIGVMSKEL